MAVEITMPKLGLTMESGTIARWLKAPGDVVRAGEPLLEVSTDKINYEVPAPASGTLGETLAREGDEFACGAVIGTLADTGEPAGIAPAPAAAAAGAALRHERSHGNGRTVASPAARRLARERGLPLAEIVGTGPRGRITLSDIHAYRSAPMPQIPGGMNYPPSLDPARRAIYRKMTEVAALPLAQVETIARVDALGRLIAKRSDFGWTAFAVYACARLLRDHPALRTDARTGAPFERIGIGVAADTPQGLIVPVVRDADTLSLAQTQAEIVRLAGLARAGTIGGNDVGGAAFSISNVGPQGVDRVAPLVDPPQTAILGIGAVRSRPWIDGDALVAARTLTCVLTFDHRFVDGAPAARFLAAFAAACDEPGGLL